MKRFLREVLRIAREVPAFASRHKVWAGIVIGLCLLAVVIYLPKAGFVRPGGALTAAERAKAESDFRGHLLQALAGLVLATGAYFTGRTFALNREGQVTERFTRAVEQLASKEVDIRLGGIYALGRIARDSETHYEPVMEVLTAFLREHARWKGETAAAASGSEPVADRASPSQRPKVPELRADFQAAATVLSRRDRRHERPNYRLDLRRVDLRRALLSPDPDLGGADLSRADLSRANLEEATLEGADLEGAHFFVAHLEVANFDGANLKRANLAGAYLAGAHLFGAHLEWAKLGGATLEEANLEEAYLEGAHLLDANLEGAQLLRAHLQRANLEEAILDRANLEGADLTGATGLTQEQLAEAFTDEETKLPEYLGREADG
jgi:uncharacterized protein YjbI with pentapeptide repeats